ncbi:MAG: glycosyltransferase [Chloroflexi bacterium]|nr:glycosyltransferase [Chloroflexota bacterium]
MVINEAFNQGIPVITTEAVGAAAGGLVQDGVNGFIVPERDPIALAKQMTKLLERQIHEDVICKKCS